MKHEKFFDNTGVPEPPSTLRDEVLTQARRAFGSEPAPSSIDRVWESRAARCAWSAAVIVSLLLLITWNPPLPGTSPSAPIETISPLDHEIQRPLMSLLSLRLSSGLHKDDTARRVIEGGDL